MSRFAHIFPPRRFRVTGSERLPMPATDQRSLPPHFLSILIAVALGTGCAHTHQVRPLGKGNAAVHASVGGPMVGVFDIVLPVPIFSAGGSYGVTDNLEVLGHFDMTAAAFGSVHYDMGLAWHPIVNEYGVKPTLTLGGGAHVLAARESVLVAPTLNFVSAWRLARRHMIYIGVDTFLPIREQVRFVAGPLLGAELRLGKRVGLALEAKYFAPWYDTNPNPPEWFSPGGFGYISALLGANVYFGDVK